MPRHVELEEVGAMVDGKDDAAAMPSFVKLLTSDLERSVRFYEGLGFVVAGRQSPFVHLSWQERAHLYLVAAPPGLGLPGPKGTGVLVCFTATAPPVDVVAERARALGAAVGGPKDELWHTREAVVTDPDGYRINFVQPMGAADQPSSESQ